VKPAAPAPEDPVELRARALAEPARRRVWDAVRAAAQPVGVSQLAATLAIHPNTVRLHLARLVEAGLVLEAVETDRHPGRPGYRYRAAGADPASDAGAYRRLAALLAHAVRARVSAREAGRAVAAAEAGALAGSDPVEGIARALAQEGFAPEAHLGKGDHIEIVLHTCPFADAAAEDPATICELHLGLAEGAAQAIGGLEVDGLHINDPYQAGCRLELRRTTQPLRRQ
jgi:predicted ArsR family transcriptional regulator